MLDLSFHIDGVEPERVAVEPILNFKLRVTQAGENRFAIQNALLRCQIRIEPARRNYGDSEKAQLHDLFGEPERWRDTLRPLHWTHTTLVLRPFEDSLTIILPVSCSYDFSRAATKYFDALNDGEIPLCFLFSGTIFYDRPGNGLQIAQIPWEKEAYFRLPAETWRALMARHYPDGAWLHLRQDVLNQLNAYRAAANHTSWEQAIEALLQAQTELATT